MKLFEAKNVDLLRRGVNVTEINHIMYASIDLEWKGTRILKLNPFAAMSI